MKKLILLSFLITTSCVEISKKEVAKPKFGLVIHGGAGTILRKNMTYLFWKMKKQIPLPENHNIKER